MTSVKNNSKYYYLSNENMSDIKESIEEYSMNFDKQSNARSKYHQSISEDIENSKTNKMASQNLNDHNRSKKNIKPPQPAPLEQPPTIKPTKTEEYYPSQLNIDEHSQTDRPIDLGFQVWETIQERYYQTNKISTDDPDVLYDFFILQKKTIKPRPDKVINEQYAKLQKLMPSMQRKMQLKLDFERMLIFKANDVMYTLEVGAHMKLRDRQLRKNENILNAELKKTEKKKRPVEEVVKRLYGQSKTNAFSRTNLNNQQFQRIKLHQFGRKLSEAYQNAMRQLPSNRAETFSKLHHFWSELYDRQEYGLQWNEQKVEKDIRTYMIQQVEILKERYRKKIGYSEENGNKLLKFLTDNSNLPDVYIPVNSFQGYVQVFNLDRRQKQQNIQKIQNQNEQKHKNNRASSEVKKFGRPVSATPLAVLSKPKLPNDYSDIYTKYGKDKLVNTLMLEDKFKMHRYPFEYGVYDIKEEIKIKGRVKPNKKQDFDDAINKMLTKTVMNQSSFEMTTRMKDRVTDMLQQQNLHKTQMWKEMGQLLKDAMLVKSYEEQCFRDLIVKYIKQTTKKDLTLKQDKYLFNQLFNYLDKLDEEDRELEISKLQRFISISQSIEDKGKQMRKLQSKDGKFYLRQRKLMHADLVQRAIEFQRMKHDAKVGKTQQKIITTRDFLNETYALLAKNHKQAVCKYFNVVDIKGDKNCPSLLRYQFYRIIKQINPLTFERDQKPRAPTWVNTKKNPQSFNYKTFNKYANTYKKDRNRLIGDPQQEKRSQSLWGQNKGKEREKLLMTYSDAKQCYFHPKVKKMQ